TSLACAAAGSSRAADRAGAGPAWRSCPGGAPPRRARARQAPRRRRRASASRLAAKAGGDQLRAERMAGLVPMAKARLGVGETVQEDVLRVRYLLHLRRQRHDLESVLLAEAAEPLLGIEERADAQALRVAGAQLRIRIDAARRRQHREHEAGAVRARLLGSGEHQAVGDVPGFAPLLIARRVEHLLVEPRLAQLRAGGERRRHRRVVEVLRDVAGAYPPHQLIETRLLQPGAVLGDALLLLEFRI